MMHNMSFSSSSYKTVDKELPVLYCNNVEKNTNKKTYNKCIKDNLCTSTNNLFSELCYKPADQ